MRLIVALAPGGATDIVARLIGQWLSERLGQPFIIENRPGAGGNIGTEAVVHAPPDGYTLLLVRLGERDQRDALRQAQFQFHPRHRAGRRHQPQRPRHGGASIGSGQDGSRVHRLCQSQSRVKSTWRRPATGAANHVSGELFKMMTGVDMVHVPYRSGGPALTDLLGGQVQVMFPATVSSIEYIRAGRLRALAVTAATRSEVLPDIPTVAEFVPGYEASNWFGVGAPKSHAGRDRREAQQGDQRWPCRSQDSRRGLPTWVPLRFQARPADFGKLIADDTEKWAKVIKFAGIKPE